MNPTDKRFWTFEAMMLLCGVSVFCLLCGALIYCNAEIDLGSGSIFILLFPVLLFYFSICGIPAWLLYKGKSWLKLAGYLYLFSALLLIVLLLLFLFDWSPVTANMRPNDIPMNEGKYLTDNEFIIIICAGWASLLIIPVLITSYLINRWIVPVANYYHRK